MCLLFLCVSSQKSLQSPTFIMNQVDIIYAQLFKVNTKRCCCCTEALFYNVSGVVSAYGNVEDLGRLDLVSLVGSRCEGSV